MNRAYRIVTTPDFDRDFKKLDHSTAQRLSTKIGWLAEHPERTEPLKAAPRGLSGLHKFRVGDFRILLWPDHAYRTLTLYAVGHRREIYRRL